MADYVSKIKLADGSILKIKDAEAQKLLNEIFSGEFILDCGTAPTENEEQE